MSLTAAQRRALSACLYCGHHYAIDCDGSPECHYPGCLCDHLGEHVVTTHEAVAALIDAAVMEARAEPPTLLPVEALALTVGLSQIEWGDTADSDAATGCILALARITGQHDWTKDAS